MIDPLSLLGTTALTEGIKFLYNQAGEILKRWREKKDIATQTNQTEPVQVKLPPSVFEGQLSEPKIHLNLVQQLEEQMRTLRKDLSDYADGVETVDVSDENLLQKIDALRQLIEAIYQQRLTFKGEQRPSSGPVVEGKIDVKQVAAYAAAVRAKSVTSGKVTGDAKAERVESGGQFIGVDVDKIGS
ncbi:MAG: hypothetical protein ICV78_27075 [Tolypothrix sp. Co-bin9]|nr:hypothetical protein [Tolypothrix sp. Co-bin9]